MLWQSSQYIIAVAKYTSEHWSENLSKWIELAGLNARASWSWKDFEGAVAGGVTGGMVGSLAGGVGALPGAAIGAATVGVGVGASAGYAARKLWNYLWD